MRLRSLFFSTLLATIAAGILLFLPSICIADAVALVTSRPSGPTTSLSSVTLVTLGPSGFLTQCPGSGCGWSGNFAPGDSVFAVFGTTATSLTITLGAGFSQVGLQIEPNSVGGAFTAQIQAYDGTTLLGTFSEIGSSNFTADNSAIYIGVRDLTAPDITSIVLSVPVQAPSGCQCGFAVNELTESTAGSTTPESSSLLLLGTGLLGLGPFLRRRLIRT